MSRAFVREDDGSPEVLPEIPVSSAPNLVTARGLRLIEAKIADGSFSPFTGQITKADGSEGVAAGATLADGEIVAMDWHVKGVATPLPK